MTKSPTTFWLSDDYITDWAEFSLKVRSGGCHLLKRLRDFSDPILVAGCQRSGTTMLSRIITQSDGMTNYWFGPDDELDAALILSGYVGHLPEGRYCFQTTYVNSCYREYFEYAGRYKMIWVLRNPYSVVFSLLHNWTPDALARLFLECGVSLLQGKDAALYRTLGIRGIPRIRQACYGYVAKTLQIFDIAQNLDAESLKILDYDDLVTRKQTLLPALYDFIGVDFQSRYLRKISSGSLNKARQLPPNDTAVVQDICEPVYMRATNLMAVAGVGI